MKNFHNLTEVGWEVNNKFFNNKVRALEEANWDTNKIHFNFRDDYFSNIDFSKEPDEDWEELLVKSCLRLRQSCNHLALWFSGGSDSHTILDIFARYNITLDELIFYDRIYGPYEYWNNEALFIKEEMYNFKKIQPNCKITLMEVDYSNAKDFYGKYKEDWFYQPHTDIRFAKNIKHIIMERHPQVAREFEREDRIDIIGREKPKLILHDNKWYQIFLDCFEFDTYITGFWHFFWDDKKIMLKQAHMAVRFFESLPNFTQELLHKIQGNEPGEIYVKYCRGIGRLIPRNDFVAFGLNKKTNNKLNPVYEGAKMEDFAKNNNSEIFHYYNEGFNYIKQNIDLKGNYEFAGTQFGKTYFLKESLV